MVKLWFRLVAAVSDGCWLYSSSWFACVSHLSVEEQTAYHHQLQDIMSLPLGVVLICSLPSCCCWCSLCPHVHLCAVPLIVPANANSICCCCCCCCTYLYHELLWDSSGTHMWQGDCFKPCFSLSTWADVVEIRWPETISMFESQKLMFKRIFSIIISNKVNDTELWSSEDWRSEHVKINTVATLLFQILSVFLWNCHTVKCRLIRSCHTVLLSYRVN